LLLDRQLSELRIALQRFLLIRQWQVAMSPQPVAAVMLSSLRRPWDLAHRRIPLWRTRHIASLSGRVAGGVLWMWLRRRLFRTPLFLRERRLTILTRRGRSGNFPPLRAVIIGSGRLWPPLDRGRRMR
jgi:hypothetical protein